MNSFSSDQDHLPTELIQVDEPSHQTPEDFDNFSTFDHAPTAIANQFEQGASDHHADSVERDQGYQHEVAQLGAAGGCYWCSGTGIQWSGGKNIKCYSCGGSGIGAR